MARLFNDEASDRIGNSGVAVVTIEPLSMAAWFYPDEDGSTLTLLSVGTSDQTDFWRLTLRAGAAGDPVACQKQAGGGAVEQTVSTAVGISGFNAWHHASCTFSATNARAIYLNGGNKATGATSIAGFTAVSTGIGGRYLHGASPTYFSGRLAECAIWAAALTDDEHAALAKGFSPLLIRPTALRFYAPLVRDVVDVRGGLALTVTGTTVSDHPRVLTAHAGVPA